MVEGLDRIANLSYFEENSEINEDRSNELTTVIQAPDNPNILNQRSLQKTDGMDVDENISHKNIKTHFQDDQVSEEIVLEDSKKMVLFPKKSVQIHQYSLGGEGNTEPSSRFKSKTELVSS